MPVPNTSRDIESAKARSYDSSRRTIVDNARSQEEEGHGGLFGEQATTP
jgi:hypothetical protein